MAAPTYKINTIVSGMAKNLETGEVEETLGKEKPAKGPSIKFHVQISNCSFF